MGLLSTIAGALFGGSETANKTIDFVSDTTKGIGTWIDNRNFTEQEASEANQKLLDTILKAVEATRDENSTRSVTRRYLAWSIMGCYLLAFLLAISVGYFYPTFANHVLAAVDKFQIGHLALAVGSFYFLATLVRARPESK